MSDAHEGTRPTNSPIVELVQVYSPAVRQCNGADHRSPSSPGSSDASYIAGVELIVVTAAALSSGSTTRAALPAGTNCSTMFAGLVSEVSRIRNAPL
jgi:hypothetical protein